MSLNKCAAVAYLFLAASLLAYGDTPISEGQRNLFLFLQINAGSLAIGSSLKTTPKDSVMFHGTFQDVSGRRTEIHNAELNSHPAESTAEDQGGILSVPEPNTGVMLGLGLFAIICLLGAGRTSRSHAGNAAWIRLDPPT